MKLLKLLTMVAIVATTVFATSCKKDETPGKPAGFGIQGSWSTGAIGGNNFSFDAIPSTKYSFNTGSLTTLGTYTYTINSDKLTLQPNMPGAPLETYDIQWKDNKYKTFNLVATGSTSKDKNATYTYVEKKK